MKFIRAVSQVHMVLGLSLIAIPGLGLDIPKPFGSLDAYLEQIGPIGTGLLFMATAFLSTIGLQRLNLNPRLALALVIPQQAVLIWSPFWSIYRIFEYIFSDPQYVVRTWMGIVVWSILCFYHAMEIGRIWRHAYAKKERESGR